jgi:DNA-binding HxlR family transcriptional regulator
LTLHDLDEQVGCLEILSVLFKDGTLSKSEITRNVKRSTVAIYHALKTLSDLQLIVEVEKVAFPYRKDVSLTEKGRRVAEHLVEVEKILSEGK